MTKLADIVDGAAFRADLVGSDRVLPAEWTALANESVLHAWNLAAGARPDFQIKSQDFIVTAGGSASFAVPTDFFGLIDVVFAPDTTSEYSLGPFAWANRRAPGNWVPAGFFSAATTGGSSVRLMGTTVYIEPSQQAAGTYRLWYCPKPTTLYTANFTVRCASPGSDIMAGAYTAAGLGVGKTITSTATNVPLVVDTLTMAIGDRFLLKNAASSTNNGIYSVTQLAALGVPWVATRAVDYDQNNEIAVGQLIFIQAGAILGGSTFSLTTFTNGVDYGTMTFSVAIAVDTVNGGVDTLDPILDPFVELLRIKTALPAVQRDDDLNPTTLANDLAKLEAEMVGYFRLIRDTNGPSKTIDTDMRGPRVWGGR